MIRAARRLLPILIAAAVLLPTVSTLARDVAFVEPGGSGTATPDEAFKIEPKPEIDIGDSVANTVRRVSFFFVNQTAGAIKIEKVGLSSDSTVSAVVTNDDCSKEGNLPPLSRCAIELSVTPTGPGPWGIELLVTHNGPGRITRAKIDGKTAGSDNSGHEHGLFLSSKEAKPVDFGDVNLGDGKIVRSALMVNDSTETITIYSVDVVEAEKSLQKLDTGCEVDMELKPGESCPVTLVWEPTHHGVISTDLIIRHSGQLGFAVIPVRGKAIGVDKDEKEKTEAEAVKQVISNHVDVIPPPPPPAVADVAREVAKAATPVPASVVNPAAQSNALTSGMHLIGTVGNRAVIMKADGSTAVVQSGDSFDIGDNVIVKVASVGSTSASLMVEGKKKDLRLEAVQELKDRAMANRKADSSQSQNSSGGGGQ